MEMLEMSPKSITSLPKEMLLQIFCYLDWPTMHFPQAYNLMNASLVCKEWRTIIFNSISSMKHLSLIIAGDWKKRNQEFLQMNYKFYKIKLSNLTVWDGLHDVFLQHGTQVRELKISDCSMLCTDFANIVSGLPMLESIIFQKVQFRENMTGFPNVFPLLNNLKSIEVTNSSYIILKYLKKSQPHTLKICCADKNDNEFYVIDFLLTHDTLENLSLHKFRIEFFCCNITNIYKNLPMKLKKLSLHVSNLRSYVLDKDNCLLQIIEGQASSLRALEMDDHILNTVVFNSFNNLKTLYLNVGRTCTPEIFCINLHPNTSVQSLLVTGDMFNHNNTSKIFALFPEVTTLGLASKSYDHVFPKEVLNIIAGCARKVDKLLLEKVSNSSVILFKFSMLKTIEIKMLEDMTHSGWATLVKNNPTIESLMIESTYGFNDHCLSIIAMKLKNLKHLKLGFGFILTMNSAKTIKKYCKNLKSLVVHKRQIQDNFDFYNALDMKNVHLIITSKLNCAMFHKRCPWYDIESSIEYSSDHPSSSDSDNMFDYDDGSEDDGNELEVIAGYIPG